MAISPRGNKGIFYAGDLGFYGVFRIFFMKIDRRRAHPFIIERG